MWNGLLSGAAGIMGVVVAAFGLWKYLDARRRDFKWRRTEFLFEQMKYLDTDEEMQEVLRRLSGWDTAGIELMFDSRSRLSVDVSPESARGLQKMLNLLDRIAYATLDAKTLTMGEVSYFGWNFSMVHRNKPLRAYCMNNGFKQVVKLAERVEQHFVALKDV
jgi:hypothetical protein